MSPNSAEGAAARVRVWRHARHAALADELEPWSHGTVVRCSRFPNVFVLSLIRVEEPVQMDAASLAAFTERALGGFSHRRIEWDRAEEGEQLRGAFHELGWETEGNVWLHYVGRVPAMPERVEEVAWATANPLRRAWHLEDRPEDRDFAYLAEWEQANSKLEVRVFVIREHGEPVAFTALERAGDSAEVGTLYVRGDRRGRGLGSEVLTGALAAAGSLRGDVWIAAEEAGRPRRLYERLGFEPVCTTLEAMRWPGP